MAAGRRLDGQGMAVPADRFDLAAQPHLPALGGHDVSEGIGHARIVDNAGRRHPDAGKPADVRLDLSQFSGSDLRDHQAIRQPALVEILQKR